MCSNLGVYFLNFISSHFITVFYCCLVGFHFLFFSFMAPLLLVLKLFQYLQCFPILCHVKILLTWCLFPLPAVE